MSKPGEEFGCEECEDTGVCQACEGSEDDCEECDGDGVCSACGGDN